MTDFTIKKNDTRPVLEATLTAADGSAIDLTGATCRFHMATPSAVKIDAVADVHDAAGGIVRYTWQEGDTDTSGRFQAEIEVTYADGGVETFPNSGNWSIAVVNEIA